MRASLRFPKGAIAESVPLVAAWALVWLVPLLRHWRWGSDDFEPRLPCVAYPFLPGNDIISVVPDLFRALMLAVLACAVAEITKLVSAGAGGNAAHLAVVSVFQVLLVLDTLRANAYDWFVYSLSYFRVISLRKDQIVGIETVWVSTFPFASLVGLAMALAGLALLRQRREVESPGSD